MELYNFFTELVSEKDLDKLSELKSCFNELKSICNNVQLVEHNNNFSIIGQKYGSDTNVGDEDLFCIFADIKYTWFDAFCPEINNIDV